MNPWPLLLAAALGAPADPRGAGLHVLDEAALLADVDEADLHLRARALHDAGWGHLRLVTLPSAPPGEAEALRAAWALPPEDLIVLIVADPPRAELSAGPPGASGLDGAAARAILRGEVEPALRRGGPLHALEAALAALEGRPPPPGGRPTPRGPRERLPLLLLALGALALGRLSRPLGRGPRAFDSRDLQR